MTIPELPDVLAGNISDAIWEDAPEFGGAAWRVGRSPDGRSAIFASRESGAFTFTFPFSEFLVVTRGSATVIPVGGEKLVLAAGDFLYCRQGTTADFEMSSDYEQVAFVHSHIQPIEI